MVQGCKGEGEDEAKRFGHLEAAAAHPKSHAVHVHSGPRLWPRLHIGVTAPGVRIRVRVRVRVRGRVRVGAGVGVGVGSGAG